MGVAMTKKTKAKIIRVVTKDKPSAMVIQALLGITRARGTTNPRATSTVPNGTVTGVIAWNFPRYIHHKLNRINTPPTMRPNSRSARYVFRFVGWLGLIQIRASLAAAAV